MNTFASPDDLTTWLTGDVPDNAEALLRSATFVIAKAVNVDPYNFTPGSEQVAPLKDATCAQAAGWVALGITPEAAGLDSAAPVKRSTILDATVERDTTGRLAALQNVASGLAPEAEAILQAAGLLWFATPLQDDDQRLAHYGLGDQRWPFDMETANSIDAFADDAWPFV